MSSLRVRAWEGRGVADYLYTGTIEVTLQAHGLDEAQRIMLEAARRVRAHGKVHSAYSVGGPRARYDDLRKRYVTVHDD